jgi:hypothetical protein
MSLQQTSRLPEQANDPLEGGPDVSILAVIAGFVAASAVMMVVETANGWLVYPELGKRAAGVTDRQEMKATMASAPAGALVVVLFGWTLGSVTGGFLATLISRKPPGGHALVLGAFLTLAGVANILMRLRHFGSGSLRRFSAGHVCWRKAFSAAGACRGHLERINALRAFQAAKALVEFNAAEKTGIETSGGED